MPKFALKFDEHGFVPALVQDHVTGEVRMLGHANEEAIERTLATGLATFWSRSRGQLWEKGRASGNTVEVQRVLVDCDGDCLIYAGEPHGATCHTGARGCFFRVLENGQIEEQHEPPQTLLATLEAVLDSRKQTTGAASYTKSLYEGGAPAIGAKICEEAGELAKALGDKNDEQVISEVADTFYHILVGLRFRSIPVRRVLAELARRLGASGHQEKAQQAQNTPK